MIRARRRPAKLPLLLMLLAAAAAMPARIWIRFGPFESFSILDVIIIAGAAVLAVRAAVRAELDLGDPVTATLLSVPVGAALLSLLWTTDISQTIKTCLILGESLTGYFLVVALLGRKPPRVIVSFGALFLLLAVMVAMLSLLHVPGFSPNIPPGYAETPEYLDFVRSYYSRLSHPSLGLSNDFATVTSFFTLFLFGWFVVSGDRRSFWFAILGTVATLLTLSRGAIAALIVGASLFMMRLPIRKAILQGAMAVTLTAAAGSAFVMLNPSTREMIAGRASTANVLARVEMVGVVVRSWRNRSLVTGRESRRRCGGTPTIPISSRSSIMESRLVSSWTAPCWGSPSDSSTGRRAIAVLASWQRPSGAPSWSIC